MNRRIDSPRQRYNRQRMLGATPALALQVVAESYGLATNVVRLGSDGSEKTVPVKWTLEQINGLLFAKWRYQTGDLDELH